MSDANQHIQKAKHNERFYLSLDLYQSPYKDWFVTGIFYTALHLIDAYLATKDIHPFSHGMRDDWIKKNRELDKIWFAYRDLKEFRMKASYKIHDFNAQEIEKEVLPVLDSIKSDLVRLAPAVFE